MYESTEEAALDRLRLKLTVTQAGVIEAVNPGAPKTVFGFEPQVRCLACVAAVRQVRAFGSATVTVLSIPPDPPTLQMLVGHSLTAAVGVFEEWAAKFGDGGQGLLAALGVRAAEGTAAADTAWRVGVRAPKDSRQASQTSSQVGAVRV